jgi:hypothetical protein
MKYKILVLLLLGFNIVAAEDVEVTWEHPTRYCRSGDPALPETWYLTQIMHHTEPMPMPSDTEGSCNEPTDPVVPEATLITIEEYTTSYTLTINQPTYARIRVCHCRDFLSDYSCFYDVTTPVRDEQGNWSGGDYVYLTWEALTELTNGDYSKVDEHLNCSNWSTEKEYLLNTTIPNPPILIEL